MRIFHGLTIIGETSDKVKLVQEQLKVARSRHKSYEENQWGDLEFQVGDKVFLKIAQMKGIIRFGRKSKLSPCYIRPFEIRSRVKDLAYRPRIPPELAAVHDAFHVSMIRKYVLDPSHVIDYELLENKPDTTYVEKPVHTIDVKEQVLRTKTIRQVKILWEHHEDTNRRRPLRS